MHEFAEWESFYVIVGGAAAALIGLKFVVMTLIADHPPRNAQEASGAFAAPTIVHFSAVLLLSALIRVPWHSVASAAIAWTVMGVIGLFYAVLVMRRMRTQKAYSPELEDWVFYGSLPVVAYLMLCVAALFANSHPGESLFAVGAAALILLFASIHNAWDAVAYHVFVTRQKVKEEEKATKP